MNTDWKTRAEAAEAERDALREKLKRTERDYIALCEKSNADDAETQRICREFQQAAFDRDALASQNAALRAEAADLRQQIRQEREAHQSRADDFEAAREREAGLLAWQALVTEAIGDAFEIAEDLNASVEFEGKAYTSQIVDLLRPWLDTSDGKRVPPPAALDQLRWRERSIGAEEELRRLAAEDCDTVFPDDLPHVTQNQLIDRADAIAAERDHIADAGKMVERAGEGGAK